MAKDKKAQIKEDEEVLGQAPVAEQEVATDAVVEKANVFPATAPIKLNEWGIPMFYVVQIGDKARIYGKTGAAVSGEISLFEASRQASRHNALDPEQVNARARGQKK